MSPRSRFFTSRFHASYSKAMKLRVHIPVMILHQSVEANFRIANAFQEKNFSLSEFQEMTEQNSSRFTYNLTSGLCLRAFNAELSAPQNG